ncbi:MAG: ATP-binding protein [Campylobacterota bacterium]|nr:ATP-binding protein [Campylobacterota bacterium]
MNLTIKNKIFSLFVIVIVIAVSAVGWFGFKSAKESYIDSALSINEGEIKALSNEIKGVLGTIPDDVIYNANFYALEKLLIWEDLKDKRKINHWNNVYLSALKDYILNKKLYYQIRILDVDGNEKILLKYNEKTNTIIQTAKDKLQNKSHRNYFIEAMKLKKGEFYISKMTLNIENGMIEKPFVPVVRYSTPLIDKNGEIKGVMVLNFNASYILEEIATAKAIDETRDAQMYYLLNEEGYYLFIGDKTKRWGFQLGTDYNFKRDYKGVLERFKDKDEITFIEDGKIFSMHKVYANKGENRYRFWYLVTEIDEDVALSSLDTFINIFFLILVVVLGFGLLLINWYISKLMNPLSKITTQLKALSKGEIKKEEIIYRGDDEIAQIVNSTSILVDAIETTINQANAVANGDFSREIELLSKNDSLGLAIKDMTARLKEITTLSNSLANGNYDVNIVARSGDDKLGLALINMVEYLQTITNVAESISLGELDVRYKAKGDDDRLGYAILEMIEYLRNILKQANAISQDDFSSSIEIKSKNDELGIALETMTNMLRDSSILNKNEIYFSEGIGSYSDALTGMSDTIKLAKDAISISCRYVGASSGVVYTFNKDKSELNLIASFAYVSRDNLSNRYSIGEGIIGQVALEREAILLKNVKDDDYVVQSGTTLAKPKEVFAFPLIHEGELFGVVEMMSFESFTNIHKDYLSKTSSIFATALHTTSQNEQIKVLLEKSQEAFEELQTQSEELQESNVQMEEQQQQLTLQSHELRIKNDTLAQAKEEIDQRAEELEKASKYKSEFLANMSHELRTPLNSIILLSKLLTNNQNETLSPKDIEKSAVIHKAGNDLLFLINDILDLSKIESGKMELVYEDISTHDIVNDMNGLFRALAEEKNIEFVIHDNYNSILRTDITKLEQVMKNLLSNAFKFTKEGTIAINIDKKDEELMIVVKDSGIGIPKDKLETIFEAFKQVDGSISREFGGTGLGLSISKNIIDILGGRITVESEFGNGTSFIVILPLSKDLKIEKTEVIEKESVDIEDTSLKLISDTQEIEPIMQEHNPENDEEYILSGKNVLIVDDDSRNIFTLTSTLESMDAEVFSAFNGKEAIELLEDEHEIDLILMDVMMPIMDGLTAMRNIKTNDKFKHIPIIAITAKTMPEDKQKCLDAGANDYLPKPLNHSAFTSMLKAWIK